MRPIAKVARIIGVDQLHVGTVVGKMSESKEEVLANIDALKAEMSGLKQLCLLLQVACIPDWCPR